MEVEAQKINLRLKMDAVTEQIASLSSGLKQEAVVSNIATPVKQTTKVVIANAASVKSNVLTGSELLSPTLVSLLNKSFCNAEPSDSQCVSK